MAFHGWPAEALEFYDGLEADNSRTYWSAHKRTYDELVAAPMHALLEELAPEFGDSKVFRPHRDVRFSADRSPYKTHIGATLDELGYVQFSARGLAAGCGMYQLAADQLERYRRAVADDVSGAGLVTLIKKIERHGIEVNDHGTALRTAPRGYPKDHPRITLLRHKALVAWQEWPIEPWLGTAEAKERVVGFLRAARPLATWLDNEVGSSRLPRHR